MVNLNENLKNNLQPKSFRDFCDFCVTFSEGTCKIKIRNPCETLSEMKRKLGFSFAFHSICTIFAQ